MQERVITKIDALPQLQRKLKVCAYARVSSGKDAMLHSLSAQVSYYNSLIQSTDGWEFVGIYADEAISGTKDTREEFNRMVEDARAGKIDLIITKAISRFARNTATLLTTIRELNSLGVDVLFEEQNIHSMSSEGEMILTLLASVAQEEARSVSENMKWRIKRNFEEGLPWGALLYGYKVVDFKYYIVEEEAKVIRLIYDLFLSGLGKEGVARKLNEMGYRTRIGALWSDSSVRQILTNYDYTGNLILQKTYRIDYICKKSVVNNGELPKYHVEESHDAIVDLELWRKAQEEMERRRNKIKRKANPVESPLKGKIKCSLCGKSYLRKDHAYRPFWICATYSRKGINGCPTKRLDEGELIKILEELNLTPNDIQEITVSDDRSLYILNKDGDSFTAKLNVHSRKDSWTPEMKQKAKERELERWQKIWQE